MKDSKFRKECCLAKGVEFKDILKSREDTIVYVNPCVSERGKVMADIDLRRDSNKEELFDPGTLCSLLKAAEKNFTKLRCSPDLGVAKIEWNGYDISIVRSGKLKIMRAPSEEDIIKIASKLSSLIWGATICDFCGRPAAECASGACGKCLSNEKGT